MDSPLRNIPGLDAIETPAYVYDLDEVRRAYGLLRAALPAPSRLFYSLKANPHPAIVRLLVALGCSVEVCSPGELAVAVQAGVERARILYTGPGKRDRDVAEAVRSGVQWFSVDSPHGLDQVDVVAGSAGLPARCLLRVNEPARLTGQALAMTGPSAFGAETAWIEAEPSRFRTRDAAALAGFHFYLGSNLSDEDALVAQFASAVRTARRLADVLEVEPELLDLGGGFAAPFARSGVLPCLADLAGRVADLLDGAFPGWTDGRPVVAFESGRYLTGTCGSLLTRVLDVKRSHGQPVVVLESGINHLGGMSGLRRLPPIVPDLYPADRAATAASDRPGSEPVMTNAVVAGPLCTPLDTWARSATLDTVRPGDVVRVPNVGAYGLYASLLAFLGHPAPREVVLDGGRVTDVSQLTLVRRRSEDGTR
ncbi:MAG TPA: type III PLP-dependent enzyme [Kribbellaceae bacterium]|nr:type III PLP-dependent enzyme [Kribbellaceae bacterium]